MAVCNVISDPELQKSSLNLVCIASSLGKRALWATRGSLGSKKIMPLQFFSPHSGPWIQSHFFFFFFANLSFLTALGKPIPHLFFGSAPLKPILPLPPLTVQSSESPHPGREGHGLTEAENVMKTSCRPRVHQSGIDTGTHLEQGIKCMPPGTGPFTAIEKREAFGHMLHGFQCGWR